MILADMSFSHRTEPMQAQNALRVDLCLRLPPSRPSA